MNLQKARLTTIGLVAPFGFLSAQQTKPNIVYIFTDQQTAEAMSCAGNNDLKTPNMDRLAKEGVRFENAYCAAPLSGPSRASMFTGIMPHEAGVLVNGAAIDEKYSRQTLGNLLQQTGYECAYGGKWHLPESDVSSQFGFRNIHNHGDIGLADSCVAFLKSKHAKPFFLVASFDNPHNICEYARKQELPYATIDEPALEKCPNLPSNFQPSPYEPEVIRTIQQNSFKLYPTVNYVPDDWRRYRNAYYRLVEHVDKEIGKVMAAILNSGLERNTVVIFSSDHGDGTGAHQWNQKSVLFEEAVHIPLIVRLPGKKDQGLVVPQIVNNGTDLFATICDYSGTDLPDYASGKSLRTIVEGKVKTEIHDYIVTETRFDEEGTLGWMVRTPSYKYVIYPLGQFREQLFDIKADKGEQVNLAIEQKYFNILNQHRKLLLEWAQKNNDKNLSKIIPKAI